MLALPRALFTFAVLLFLASPTLAADYAEGFKLGARDFALGVGWGVLWPIAIFLLSFALGRKWGGVFSAIASIAVGVFAWFCWMAMHIGHLIPHWNMFPLGYFSGHEWTAAIVLAAAEVGFLVGRHLKSRLRRTIASADIGGLARGITILLGSPETASIPWVATTWAQMSDAAKAEIVQHARRNHQDALVDKIDSAVGVYEILFQSSVEIGARS